MRDILDPADRWLGVPGAAPFFGNKRPVAVNDAVTVLKDGGPVTVNVLANDFDPEGGALTLTSANAALGTAAVAPDNTVTYTPPLGISGFDTVVYEIADDQDQRRTAQIDVTIIEPQLSIEVQTDNTLVINSETGLIDITVTDPPHFAGTYQIDTADLLGGPINIVPPSLGGTGEVGQSISAISGLWIYDTGAGVPLRTWQWLRNGLDIAGATTAAYAVTAADAGADIGVRETQTDAFGQRSALSSEQSVAGGAFSPGDDALLTGWWAADDAATLTQTGGALSAWANKAGGAALVQTSPVRQPLTGTRHLNGLNVVDFGGSFMEQAATLPASGNVAFHMAAIIDGSSNAFEAILAVEATNDFQLDSNNATQFDGRLNVTGIGNSVALTGGPFSGPVILSIVFDLTGGTANVFVGNTLRGSAPYTTAIDTGAMLHLMTNRSRNAFANGAVAELVVTGNITNRSDHHSYLANKWGIA